MIAFVDNVFVLMVEPIALPNDSTPVEIELVFNEDPFPNTKDKFCVLIVCPDAV